MVITSKIKKLNPATKIVETIANKNGNREMAKLAVNLRDSGAGMSPNKKVVK
ncbi:hypothetical protein QN372_00405 [Undibacterium sp. RTI2.1]|uniref:hypothetical protein n=1 Tax=unclassified Undibacterium TaxID=2630295 RepID=UPI002AB38E6A|nr:MULTISPECIES: hypothetical protein [unclassified Undibacterium]MDY7537600.1 hypothetical protein [Undibacterium sp. 5I1]MEB0029200.1 hypothetical protein [Undibacterium sp. RTI2.1]MEB0115508.1 hypothetical protein [Undibacterium sp. RTI2.2]MEB0230144.1 hypothetical protein [Undibacterium sp. 10I3]MEB0256336.1 hypothetical protein [Undibacterium sp. 5I1]